MNFKKLFLLLSIFLVALTPSSPARSDNCVTKDGFPGLQLYFDCFALDAEHLDLAAQDFTSALEQFRNVKRIVYHGGNSNEPPDISALSTMNTLESLTAGLLVATSLEPLSNLKKLKFLAIGVLDADVTPLNSLGKLETLYLNSTGHIDAGGLSGTRSLKKLELDAWKGVDARSLGDLPELRELTMIGDAKLGELTGLPLLQSVSLIRSKSTDISAIVKLKNLSVLSLSTTQVTNFEQIKNAKNLTKLMLYAVDVKDISPIESLATLKALILHDLPVDDLSPLQRLVNLRALQLIGVEAELGPLKNIPNLSSLRLPDGKRLKSREEILEELKDH